MPLDSEKGSDNLWILKSERVIYLILEFYGKKLSIFFIKDRLCGRVVRVPRYGSRGPGFDSWHYQIFWDVVGLEWGLVSLVSTTEELLGRESSGSGLESREYGRRDPLCWPRNTLYLQTLTLTSPTNGSRLVGKIRSGTKATGFVYVLN
jgi:hypothetical protein